MPPLASEPSHPAPGHEALDCASWSCASLNASRGRRSVAVAYILIERAKRNGVDPQAWLIDVLGRNADHKITRTDELLPSLALHDRAITLGGVAARFAQNRTLTDVPHDDCLSSSF